MIPQEALAGGPWVHALRAVIGDLPRKMTIADLQDLSERVTATAWHGDCPTADLIADPTAQHQYRRHLIASGQNGEFTALLIAWPPNHRTPLHDHDGLWGIELVIDGALAVHEYRAEGDADAKALRLQRSLVLGIGDATTFIGRDYVHTCRNLSPNRIALSLHLYGGELEHYSRFDADESGHYRTSRQRTQIDVAWI